MDEGNTHPRIGANFHVKKILCNNPTGKDKAGPLDTWVNEAVAKY